IAIDGDYLNQALRKKALVLSKADDTSVEIQNGRPRLRIDYERLADLLRESSAQSGDNGNILLNYYTERMRPLPDGQTLMGKVNKYWPERTWGFITATDGKSYFFHQQ